MKRFRDNHLFESTLCEESPLRKVDPRSKLFMSLIVSLVVMLPLDRLAIFFTFYLVFMLWAGLFSRFIHQVYRLKWILIVLFIVDWVAVSPELAGEVTLRLILITSVFTTLISTTTPGELGLAFEALHIPYRLSFSLNLAFQSLGLLQEEWHAIWEAQKSRGILPPLNGFRILFKRVGDLVALTVPAIVLTTRRAWAITECAYARGFDSPKRVSYHTLRLHWPDWAAMLMPLSLVLALYVWR
jgi:energy-coupling factor transporter transmembrane protein EcfT